MRSTILVVLFMLATGSAALASSLSCPDGVAGGVIAGTLTGSRHVKPTGEVTLPVPISKKAPAYPAVPGHPRDVEAKEFLQATIDVDGKTGDFQTLACTATRNGNKLRGDEKDAYCTAYSKEAAKAFAEWRFSPAKRDGKPVCVYFTVKFAFDPR